MNKEPEFSLDWPHGWQTRDEREAMLLAQDLEQPYTLGFKVRDHVEGYWNLTRRIISGQYSAFQRGPDPRDIINKPAPPATKKTMWQNWYADPDGRAYGITLPTRKEADQEAESCGVGRIACIEIEIPEPGTGLEGGK